MKQTIFSLAILFFIFISCKKEVDSIPDPLPANNLEIKVNPIFGTEQLYLDSIYTTDEGYKFQVNELRFYATNFMGGSKQLFDVALFNFKETGKKFFTSNGLVTDYLNLSFTLGVDSVRNHADPSSYSVTNPLNIAIANDMHWGWNPGYIFIYMDAKVDTIPDNTLNLDHFISYHIGGDNFKKQLNFSNIGWFVENKDLSTATMILDVKKFLTTPNLIDVKTNNINHTTTGMETFSDELITNFANAISF